MRQRMQTVRAFRISAVCVVVAAAGAVVGLAYADASSPAAFEVSEDGRLTVDVAERDAATPSVASRTSDEVPFGDAPDQVVNLRRQIGGLAIADMDNDGNNDVVAVVFIGNSFPPYTEFQDQVFFGNGAGIDTTPGWLSDDAIHTADVALADINGDGFTDIVTVHGGGIRSDTVRVYFGAVGGPSTSAGYVSTTPGAWGTEGELVDIDNDGDLDLATSNQGLSPDPFRPNYIFRNIGGTFATAPSWISSDVAVQKGVAAADFNGDGWQDLAVAKSNNAVSGIYFGQPGQLPELLPSVTVDPLVDASRTLAVAGDLDGDRQPELLLNGDPGKVYDVSQTALTPVYSSNPPFSSPQETRLFDVDDDGDLDVAEVHFGDGRAHIYLNRGGVIDVAPSWTFDAPEVGNSLAFGDLNNDGAADLVIGYSGDPSIRVFFAEPPVQPDCPGDTNGDLVVDGADLLTIINNFGSEASDRAAGGDLNGDKLVDGGDLLLVINNFGAAC